MAPPLLCTNPCHQVWPTPALQDPLPPDMAPPLPCVAPAARYGPTPALHDPLPSGMLCTSAQAMYWLLVHDSVPVPFNNAHGATSLFDVPHYAVNLITD